MAGSGYSNPSNTVAIRSAIINQLITELNPASGGRLVGVQGVGRAWLDEAQVYPYIGVHAHNATWQNYATRQRYKTDTFLISLSCKVAGASATLQGAYDLLFSYLDDGNGNGLEVVLSDPTLYSWNALAHTSYVMRREVYDNFGDDKSASPSVFVAYAIIQYDVKQTVFFNGTVK